MELREYLSIRRAFNIVRQKADSTDRLTFFELAILCRLKVNGGPLNTSEIAEYQGSLRPTMTHRTKHLSAHGLLDRIQGTQDRRNVVCAITERGSHFADDACRRICSELHSGSVLTRTTPQRICRYVDAMGSLGYMSGDLIVLGIANSEGGGATISSLVEMLGLLQPTVSMAVSTLEEKGLVERTRLTSEGSRSAFIGLTEAGFAYLQEMLDAIHALVVRRS